MSTRLIACTFVLFLLNSTAFSQTGEASPKQDNLYSRALIASITEMQKEWGYIDDSDEGIRTDYNHMIASKNPEITDDLPSEFDGHHVEYLDNQELIEKHKALKKDFSILEIHPLHNEGTRLRIQVGLSWIEYKKGRLRFAISSWSDVYFEYDCDSHAYVISSVKLGGI
jgi:hypothetical protein